MKKRFLALTCVIALLFTAGCGKKKDPDARSAWERFSGALERTAGLDCYEITENHTVNGETTSRRLVLTKDEMGRTVAYKSTASGELWWFQGLTYDASHGEKLKYAEGIDTFLDISGAQRTWDLSMVSDIYMDRSGKTVTFSVPLEGYESCKVSAKLGEQYVQEISVEVIRRSGDAPEIIAYLYKDPGRKPTLTLPADIDDYHY